MALRTTLAGGVLLLAPLLMMVPACPSVCRCRQQMLGEVPAVRYAAAPQNATEPLETAVCVLTPESGPEEVVRALPRTTAALTMAQGPGGGDVALRMSHLDDHLPQLVVLDVRGMQEELRRGAGGLLVQMDRPLAQLRYLNLDSVRLEYSRPKPAEEVRSHGVEILSELEILPYEVYRLKKAGGGPPLFAGFERLQMLRVHASGLDSIYWEMFDGLADLQHLSLERNGLRFVPDFAFYGTPGLRRLSLAGNDLLDMQIMDLAGLLDLEHLDLSHNSFAQLSELSFPPFPRLEEADLSGNPIAIVFPNTFEVMNTTKSLVLGSAERPIAFLPRSFNGLSRLERLVVRNVKVSSLKRDLFDGMPQLKHLEMNGVVVAIEYDAFVEVERLETLLLRKCRILDISMDSFYNLDNLTILDLSYNEIDHIPPGMLDGLKSLRELHLEGNKLTTLPIDLFTNISPKLVRLSNNPWNCSCALAKWNPMAVQAVQKVQGDPSSYGYDRKVAPRCSTPEKYKEWNVFHVLKTRLKCDLASKRLHKALKEDNRLPELAAWTNDVRAEDDNALQPMAQSKSHATKPRKPLGLKEKTLAAKKMLGVKEKPAKSAKKYLQSLKKYKKQ